MRIPLLLFIFLLSASLAQSQSRTSYYLGVGGIYYQGELNDHDYSHSDLINTQFSAGIGYNPNNNLTFQFHFMHGKLTGADSLSSRRGTRLRNLSFQSTVDELSFRTEYKMFATWRKRFINPFVYAGAGVFWFNPKAELDGELVELKPLGTEGQFIQTDDDLYNKPYNLVQGSGLIGGGVYFRLSDYTKLRFDAAVHLTLTDYIDDVSSVFPDSLALATAPNGSTAILLSDRNDNGAFPKGGNLRGNESNNDSYVHFGIGLEINLAGDSKLKSIFRKKQKACFIK
ncbi:MAG: hypothetical protein HKO56_00155 [Bacteroidia bacterium]|nr:hypothetical protein [Bacteroidia bacterium]NNC86472.1 hypothetical protein [Bacteroidia bacterium]NNM15035.1 hypothetical protein [Bacteroidia bacterium]